MIGHNHLTEEMLLDYTLELLDPAGKKEADTHLATCGECREELARWQEITARTAVWPDQEVPEVRSTDMARRVTAALRPETMPGTRTAVRAPVALSKDSVRDGWLFLLAGAAAAILLAVALIPFGGAGSPLRSFENIAGVLSSPVIWAGLLLVVFTSALIPLLMLGSNQNPDRDCRR